jgi:hypothetical protein
MRRRTMAKIDESDTTHKAPGSSAGKASGRRKSRRKKRKRAAAGIAAKARRGRAASVPFPPVTFSSVLPFAEAIQQHGAGQPIRRLTLFEKLDRSPESGSSRMLIVNAGRYGLISGGYQAELLELTDFGKVATSPDADPREKLAARFKLAIESVPAFKFLYEKNRGQRLPSPEVMRDSLAELDLDEEHRKECVEVFLENLKFLGLLRTIAGAERVVPIEQALEEILGGSSSDPVTTGGSAKTANLSADGGPPRKARDWKTTCFVISPIDDEGTEKRKHSDMMLEALITRALEGERWTVIRADQISKPGMISGQVIEYLVKSRLVVADLSFHNPNVFYELAIRHVVGLPTVHLIRKGDAIPFDLKDFRTITIDTEDKYELVAKLETYRAEIANYVRETVSDVSDASNPIRIFAKELVVTIRGQGDSP